MAIVDRLLWCKLPINCSIGLVYGTSGWKWLYGNHTMGTFFDHNSQRFHEKPDTIFPSCPSEWWSVIRNTAQADIWQLCDNLGNFIATHQCIRAPGKECSHWQDRPWGLKYFFLYFIDWSSCHFFTPADSNLQCFHYSEYLLVVTIDGGSSPGAQPGGHHHHHHHHPKLKLVVIIITTTIIWNSSTKI